MLIHRVVIQIVLRRLYGVLSLLVVWFGLMAAVNAAAENPVQCQQDCVPVGEWSFRLGIGAGVRVNPLNDGDDTPLVLLPELSYYGKRFFLKNFELGYTFLETDRHQLNGLVSPSYDQMLFNRWDPLNFTDSGGAPSLSASVSSLSAPTYRVVVTDGNGSKNALDPADSSIVMPPDLNAGTSPSPGPELPRALVAVVPAATTVAVNGVSTIFVNGVEVPVSPGRHQTIAGSQDNVIGISATLGGFVSVSGVSDADQVRLQGDNLEIGNSGSPALRGGPAQPQPALGGDITVGFDGSLAVIEPVQVETGSDTSARPVSIDEVRKRKVAGLMGLEYSYQAHRFSFHIQALQDFTRVHKGAEARIAVTLPMQYKTHQFALTAGANWQSQKVIDYYYGVTDADIDDSRVFYSPSKAAVTPLLRLDWQKSISAKWSLRGFVQYMPLSEPVKASPLVGDSNITAVFLGGVYHF